MEAAEAAGLMPLSRHPPLDYFPTVLLAFEIQLLFEAEEAMLRPPPPRVFSYDGCSVFSLARERTRLLCECGYKRRAWRPTPWLLPGERKSFLQYIISSRMAFFRGLLRTYHFENMSFSRLFFEAAKIPRALLGWWGLYYWALLFFVM